jgi:hypothetical protein
MNARPAIRNKTWAELKIGDTFVARAEAAGLALEAKAPVMLTSRADNDRARLASCALAELYQYYGREGRAFTRSPTEAAE